MKKTELLIEKDGLKVYQILEDCEVIEVKKTDDDKNGITTNLLFNDREPLSLKMNLNVNKGMHVKTSIIQIDKKEIIAGRIITGTHYKEKQNSAYLVILNELFGGIISYRNGVRTITKQVKNKETGIIEFEVLVSEENTNGNSKEEIELMKKENGIHNNIIGLIILWLIIPLVYLGLMKIGFEKVYEIIAKSFKIKFPIEFISKLKVCHYLIFAGVLTAVNVINFCKKIKINREENIKKNERMNKYRTTLQYEFESEEDFYEYCKCKGLYAEEKSDQFLGLPLTNRKN